jgi:FG-GAP-like repeat/Secretion system C-terminal sorting domain
MNPKSLLFLSLLLVTSLGQAQQFIKIVPTGAMPLYDASKAWIDFDNDGDLDILTSGKSGTNDLHTFLYVNSPSGFASAPAPFNNLPPIAETNITFINTNGDDRIDVLLIGRKVGVDVDRMAQLENRTTGFIDIGTIADVQNEHGYNLTAAGDVNNDGTLDLFYSGLGYVPAGATFSASLLTNINGNYTKQEGTSFIPLYLGMARLVDLDNDQDLDLITSGTDDAFPYQQTFLYWNDGAGNFTLSTAEFTKLQNTAIDIADYDGDHDLDILMAGYNEFLQCTTRLYRNTGGSFTSVALPASINRTASGSVHWADYDNDDDPDILISGELETGSPTKIGIFRNDGSSQFTEVTESAFEFLRGSVFWGDYDNDGDLDILMGGGTDEVDANDIPTSVLGVLRNEGTSKNNAPGIPANLFVEAVSETSWHLTWAAAMDDHTPQGALTYNLSLRMNEPNKIILPSFSSESGKRKIAEAGNVWLNRSWNFKNLPVGSYTANVQAIDGGLAGSAWSNAVLIFSGEPQAAPTELTAHYDGGIALNWSDQSNNEEYFVIERRTEGEEFEKIDSVTYGITTFTEEMPGLGLHEYRVYAVNPNGRTGYTNIVPFLITATDKDFVNNDFVYPNPTSGTLILRVAKMPYVNVIIHGSSGEEILQQQVSIENEKAMFDIHSLPAGIYLLKLKTPQGQVYVTKLLKQ